MTPPTTGPAPAKPKPPPRGARLVLAASSAGGALVFGIVFFGLWLANNPSLGPGQFIEYVGTPAVLSTTLPLFLLAGALIGLLVAGYMIGNRAPHQLLRRSVRFFGVAAGGLIGATLGLVAFILYRRTSGPDESFAAAIGGAIGGLGEPGQPGLAFLFGGALTGLIVTTYIFGGRFVKDTARALTGAVVGGVAGLVIYSVAYVITFYPSIPQSSEYVVHFAEAIYMFSPVEYLLVGLGVCLGLMMARYSWRLYGVFTLIALVSVVLGYLMYTLAVTLPSLPEGRRWFSIILFVAEAASLTLVLLYSFYTIDVATRKHWRRTPRDAAFSSFYMPKVVFQVPCYNEPPELVIDTIKSLLCVDYPGDRFLIQVVDDSTQPESSEPVKAFCQKYGVNYLRRGSRKGYKAGALNYANTLLPEDVELIAIIDADYQVQPEYLRETVGFFLNPELGWLQTPQDYRNREQSFLTEQYYLADAYFYRSVLPSRNEENTIIFCGTMGILRRKALEQAGGWGEQYITEDAELSIRLVSLGWKSLYVNKTYGRGLIPSTFEGYKKQHYRWAFGGGRILRGHFTDFLFGRLSGRQWYDYFLGNVHWFEGLFLLIIATSVLMMGIADIIGLEVVSHHANEIMLIGLVPWFLLIDGVSRLHMVLRKSLNLSFGGTFRVLGMWFSVKFSNGFGALKALVGFQLPFLRTPKAPSTRLTRAQALRHAIRLTRFESTCAALFAITFILVLLKNGLLLQTTGLLTPSRVVLAFWLFSYMWTFLAAPLYAYKSYATFKPMSSRIPRSVTQRGVAQ